MQATEFVEEVRSYGVSMPHGVAGSYGGNDGYYRSLFGFETTGSGNPREYTDTDVRRVVAYAIWMDLVGSADVNGLDAIRLMTRHDSGWVIVSPGNIQWSDSTPTPSVFVGGAICVPVPEWVA